MTESPKLLLPCPFCGGKARIKPMLNMTELRIDHAAVCVMYGKRYSVAHPGDTMPVNAFEAWNRRAQDPERAAMAKVCEAAQVFIRKMWTDDDYDSAQETLATAIADLKRVRNGKVVPSVDSQSTITQHDYGG